MDSQQTIYQVHEWSLQGLSYTFQGLLVHTGLYNIHIILFALSVYIHVKKRTSGLWIHLTAISAMFALSTISYFATVHDVFRRFKSPDDLIYPSLMFYYNDLAIGSFRALLQKRLNMTPIVRICYILSNLIADLYITYRCFVVWGRSKRAVALPLILITAMFVCQFSPFPETTLPAAYMNHLGSLLFTGATNLLVTLLTAGRIWWIGHQGRSLLGQRVLSKYNRTIQIVIESGILYPASLLVTLLLIFNSSPNHDLARTFAIAVTISIVNIAPTLIVIRVGLGVSVDDVMTTLKTVKAAPQNPSMGEEGLYHEHRESVTIVQHEG